MFPDPARLTTAQVAVSIAVVLIATVAASLLVLHRGLSRRVGRGVVCVMALGAVAAWLRFGDLHAVPTPGDPATVRHVPFQFHEFFHYYLGPKYFGELGYLGLYDCTALADLSIADEDGAAPRLHHRVRDLADVLAAKPLPRARDDCRGGARARFTPRRWAAFVGDIRELQRVVPDAWWDDVVDDKGLNAPPTAVLLESAVANLIPIRAGGLPTYLLTSSVDAALIGLSFLVLARAFGTSAAALGAVTFGASFLASYGWLGGAVLRFTWVFALVLSLALMRRGRWALAGALMGWAICDRVFPVAFALGAVVPLAWRMRESPRQRAHLVRFCSGVGCVVTVAASLGVAVFGASSFHVFATRLMRDASVHNVLHVGLDKILTYRSWVPSQSFGGYDGLERFRAWNERIDATWASVRIPAAVLQLVVMALAAFASRRRRPFEASVLLGVTGMFILASPSSYYFVVLSLVPVMLFRAATLGPERERAAQLTALIAFEAFCLVTLLAPQLMQDAIVFDLVICIALFAALLVWMGAWSRTGPRRLAA